MTFLRFGIILIDSMLLIKYVLSIMNQIGAIYETQSQTTGNVQAF